MQEPEVYIGFRRDLEPATLARWVDRQEVQRMLEALHRLPVAAGDTILVPAGVPHVIGEGVFLVELQEPTDFSVLLEWRDFELDGPRDGHLGLGFELALSCIDCSGWEAERVGELRGVRGRGRRTGPGVELALPPEADRFFRAQRVRPGPESTLEAAFAVLVVISGAGTLEIESGETVELRRGDTAVVPFAAGQQIVRGGLEMIRCLPPIHGGAEDVRSAA